MEKFLNKRRVLYIIQSLLNQGKHFVLLLVYIFIYANNLNSQTYTNFYLSEIGSFNFVKNGNEFKIEAINLKYQSNYSDSPNYLFDNFSTISDTNYNQLLYTSANRVYSKRNKLVSDSDIIFDEVNVFDSLRNIIKYKRGINLIRHLYVKRPGTLNQYLLFYVNPFNNLLNYCVIQYNVVLDTYTMGDKNIELDKVFTYSFDITHHKNGKDLWIVRSCNNNLYVSSLITENEIGKINTFSSLGSDDVSRTLEYYNLYYLNYTKISPDGKYLAFVTNSDIELKNPNNQPKDRKFNPTIANFDNNTGKVSNKVLLETHYDGLDYDILNAVVDIEFSAKSNSFFIINTDFIYKYNYDEVKQEYIKDIYKFDFLNSQGTKYLASFLGPDKNIYFISHNSLFEMGSKIGIKNCELFTIKGDYNYKQSNKINKSNLTNVIYETNLYLFHPFEIMTSQLYEVETELTQNVCFGSEIILSANVLRELPDTIYKWTGPNNFISYEQNPKLLVNNKDMEGLYKVEVYDKNQTIYFTGFTTLRIKEIPYFNISKNKEYLCNNSNIKLSVKEYFPDGYSYLWTNGDTLKNINISEAGEYSLTITNDLGCSYTKKITIEKVSPLQFNLTKDGEECGSSEIILKSDVEFPTTFKYLWNTGAITPELKVSKNGVYTLIVTDTNGCQTSKSIEIIFGKKPIVEVKAMGATTFCEGGRVELRATGGMSSSDLNFEWNTGEKVQNIWVDKSGIYKVIITHKFSNCVDSAEIEIKVNPNLVSKIEQIGALCKGGEVELQAEPQGTEYKYLWSNGATTPSIKVSQAGKYTVEVSLDGTCKSSAEIEVFENQAQDFEILADGKFCVGEIVKLSSDKDFAKYEWSNSETTREINVTLSGTYNLIITDENGCTNEKSIDVEFVSPREYKLDFTDYDFGNVEIGTEKRVKVNIPGELGFSLRGDFSLDITTMEMVFKADTERDYSGEIVLNYGGDCDTSVTINFKGRGVNSIKYFAKVIAPKVTTEAGLDNVELPIKFEINDEKIIYPFELDYKIKLSLNYDVYIPQIPSTINGTKREIEIAGKAQITKGENILSTIIGKTYLSQNMENDIEILNFEHKTDRFEVEQEDGYLNITGICVPELRGLIFFTPTKMSISPNPVSSDLTIKINTEEKGNHKLRLVDITGNSREIGDFVVKELTEKVLKINAKELSKGQYFLELITPNQTIVEKVVVE